MLAHDERDAAVRRSDVLDKGNQLLLPLLLMLIAFTASAVEDGVEQGCVGGCLARRRQRRNLVELRCDARHLYVSLNAMLCGAMRCGLMKRIVLAGGRGVWTDGGRRLYPTATTPKMAQRNS